MCEQKCGVPVGAILGAAGALAVAVVVVRAVASVVAFLPLVTLSILSVCAAGCVVLYRVVRYGGALRPAQRRSKARPGLRVVTARTRGTAEIVAASRQIEAPARVLVGVVINRKEAAR